MRKREGLTMQPDRVRDRERERESGRRVTEVYSLFCAYSKTPRPDVQNSVRLVSAESQPNRRGAYRVGERA